MSRSALWHQERNIQKRQAEAEETWQEAVEEGRNNRARNLITLWGPDDSFRFEPLLLDNIKKSSYFVKVCREIKDWTALVDEIYYKVDHMEPWAPGGVKTPSMGFSLLLRLLTMRSTTNQMELMLKHVDSAYIRAVGFLYLRYSCEPEHLFKWFQPYLYDEEPIQVGAGKKKAGNNNNKSNETIGSFVRSLLSRRDYYGTMLPRLPIQIERNVQVQLLQAEKVQNRATTHARNKRTMDYFQKPGARIMATYEDEENPLQWYEAEVDRVIRRTDDDQQTLKHPKFVVTFTQYGNTETVTLGEMDVPDGPFYKEDTRAGRGYDNRHERGKNDLYEEVRRREQEQATGSRGNYFARVETTKNSLAAGGTRGAPPPQDRRRRSPSPSRGARKRSPPREGRNREDERSRERQNSPPRKRTAEEMAAIQEKKRKLMAKYG
eukprot:Sro1343_g264640.1 splicing factor 38B (434) ;mRNA; r:18348-20148